MNINLLNLFRQATGSDFIIRLSVYLNEEATDVKNAMAIIVPAVLSAFIKKTSTENLAETLFHFIQYYASAHFSLPIESKDQMHEFIKLGGVVLNNISPVQLAQKEIPGTVIPLSKLKTESVESLKQIAGCVFKELIFRELVDNDLDDEDLRQWLQSQNAIVLNAQKDAEQMVFAEIPGKLYKSAGARSSTESTLEPIDQQSNVPLNEAKPLKTYKVVRLLVVAIISMILLYFLSLENSSVENSDSPDSPILEDSTRGDIPAGSPGENDPLRPNGIVQ